LRQLHRADAWDGDVGDGEDASNAVPRLCVVRPWRWEYDIASWPPGSAGFSEAAFRTDRAGLLVCLSMEALAALVVISPLIALCRKAGHFTG
jgi:hypothetical protein